MRKIIMVLLLACMGLGVVSCAYTDAGGNQSTDGGTVQTMGALDTDKKYTDTFTPQAKIVNKNGAKGVVTYVLDDYFKETGYFAESMLDKYEDLTFSFAVVTKDLATLQTKKGIDGDTEYVKDANGKYVYTVNENNVYFLEGLLDTGRVEVISHSHTHAFWGTNDNGGRFEYMKNDGTFLTSEVMPKGSVSKELEASKQIISELFPTQRAISFVEPGILVRTSDVIHNGKNITTYKTYFMDILKKAIESGEYIGSRGTFQATNGFDKYVNTRLTLSSVSERMNVKAFMILNGNAGNGIENWTNYIDTALNYGGWACFCIHKITPTADPTYHHILQSQAKQLFAYTDSLGEDVWVATFTDAMLYFSEWSTAKVSAEYEDGTIVIKLTDKENDAVYNMPLTVKVTVPTSWSTASVGGKTVSIHRDRGVSYVYVDAVPDAAPVEIVEGN